MYFYRIFWKFRQKCSCLPKYTVIRPPKISNITAKRTDDFQWMCFVGFFFLLTHIRRQTWNALGNTSVRFTFFFFLVCWHVLLSIVSWGGSKIRCSHEILQFLRAFNGQNKKKSVSQNIFYSFIHFVSSFSLVWMQKSKRQKKWTTRFEILHLN